MSLHNPEIIWYASDEYARNPLRLLVCQDKGSLTLDAGEISFQGHRRVLTITKVQDVRIARQSPSILAIILMAVFISLFAYFRGAGLVPICLGTTIGVVCMFVVNYVTKWVRIVYQDEAGNEAVAWFADGSGLGWSGILYGTSQLYQLIHRAAVHVQSTGSLAEAFETAFPVAGRPQSENPYATESPDVLPHDGVVLGRTPRLQLPRQAKSETCPWCEAYVTPDEDGRCTECDRPIT